MEWVTTTASTVDEAKERALDQLGVAADDAEFEVLEEPKKGMFGRLRGEARVRARVRPTLARQKVDRRDRRREKGERAQKPEVEGASSRQRAASPSGKRQSTAANPGRRSASGARNDQRTAPHTPQNDHVAGRSVANDESTTRKDHDMDAHQVGEEARRFAHGLLEAFGVEGEVTLIEEGDDLELRIDGKELGLLVGPRGTTLHAVQDLARVASQRRLGDHDTRLRLDIGGYRERRRAALGSFALQMAEEVTASGVARVLEPMSSADRKVIHDTLTDVEGIATRSEGDDPYRRVVIAPANE